MEAKTLARILEKRANQLGSYSRERFSQKRELELAEFQCFLAMELNYLAALIRRSND